nr:TetR/AcrR family transcriptional regulator [uncultured Lacibacter sp.]
MAVDQKQEMIIEAAIKRFAHFGVNKTTMNEIAADLSISKALLYYYFPDKKSLFAAVLKHITSAAALSFDEVLAGESDPQKAILTFLDSRTDFIIRYYNIVEYLRNMRQPGLPPELKAIFDDIRKRDLGRIAEIMEKGKNAGIFQMENASKTAELYFDFLEGFRMAYFVQSPAFFPDGKQFRALLKREKEFSVIFLKGLTK